MLAKSGFENMFSNVLSELSLAQDPTHIEEEEMEEAEEVEAGFSF